MKVQEIIKVLGDFRLKKSKGQNFLIDKKVISLFVDSVEINEKDNILEIGPGLGALTEELTKRNVIPLCVEIEKKFCEFLKTKFRDKIRLRNDDFLRLNEQYLDYPNKIIGSLPYRGAKRIISNILYHFKNVERCVFLLQKEVADSIISMNNSKDYGPLSVIAQLRCELKKIKDVSPEVFYPKPNVQSSIIVMEFKRGVINGGFYKFINLIFKQRRKTVKNNLKGIMDIDINKRAEELTPEEIYNLYLENLSKK